MQQHNRMSLRLHPALGVSACALTCAWLVVDATTAKGTDRVPTILSQRSDPVPSVYWVSAPTRPNETLVVAGSFGNAYQDPDGTTMPVQFCTFTTCHNATASVWAQSLKVVVPTACPMQGPCALRLAYRDSQRVDQTQLYINAPDVWWYVSILRCPCTVYRC